MSMDSMQFTIFTLVVALLIIVLLWWIYLDHSEKTAIRYVSTNVSTNSSVNALGESNMSESSKNPLSWSAKPFMKKTLVKFGIIFIAVTVLLIATPLVGLWIPIALVFFGFYYPSKNSFTYHITDSSVKIEKSWVFGNYSRELTFDQILDIRIYQGILAIKFDCGSLVFVTKTGLEVGKIVAGGGDGGARRVTPTVLQGRGNTFWDIIEPEKAKELLMYKLAEWRTVYQQQSMAQSLGVIAGKAQPVFSTSMAEELTKLKNLYDNGAITKEEYEKAKQKQLS